MSEKMKADRQKYIKNIVLLMKKCNNCIWEGKVSLDLLLLTKYFYSMRIVSLCLWMCLSIRVFAQQDTVAYRLLAQKIQKEYAPDKRSEFFQVDVKRDTIFLESTSSAALEAFELNGTSFSLPIRTRLLPDESLKGQGYAVSNLSVSNHRSLPQHGAELMTQTLLGTPLQVLKRQGGFYLVRSPDGYLAWVDGGGIKLMDKIDFDHWQKAPKLVFTADYGHAYQRPAPAEIRVSDLVAGNILRRVGDAGFYYKVAFPDGREAYVSKKDVQSYEKWVKKSNPQAKELLETAHRFLGVPYLWGGTSGKGMDCSGFTKTSFFLNGVIIPRDASQQVLVGEPVDVMTKDSIDVQKCLNNLLPGDLLFFSAAKARGLNGGRITHTAIYIGHGDFIQAAGMVKISSLIPGIEHYDSGQSPTLVGARRLLTAIGRPGVSRVDQHQWYLAQ